MNTYICNNPECTNTFERYPSTVRNPDTVCCSNECRGALQSIRNTGKNNPNYKGILSSVCIRCGSKKDPRSKSCARCAKTSYAIQEALKPYTDLVRDNPLGSAMATLTSLSQSGQLQEVVAMANSYSGLAQLLGVSRGSLTKHLPKFEIDTSHFTSTPYTAETLLTQSDSRRNGTVRKFILDNDLLPYVCSECGQEPWWNGKPLTIELDHIDGDACNNRLENLRFLCGHCHSQTPTFRGRRRKER